MATVTVEQSAVAEIVAYVKKHGGGYSAWYIGIASDPKQRLFTDHIVQETGGRWVYYDCGNDASARRAEQAFLNAGCQGGGGGGDWRTRFVYAYKVTANTRE